MPRLQPLPPETTPELKDHFDFFLGTLGFTPNSVLTMQRKPKLVRAFAQLNGAVMDPQGEVDLGFRRLIGHVVSKASTIQPPSGLWPRKRGSRCAQTAFA